MRASAVARETISGTGEGWTQQAARVAPVLQSSGAIVMRAGLVVLILWFGVFKFTPTEAEAIRPLVAHSPLLAWLYAATDVRRASYVIGSLEILIALLIAVRPVWPRVSALGSLAAV